MTGMSTHLKPFLVFLPVCSACNDVKKKWDFDHPVVPTMLNPLTIIADMPAGASRKSEQPADPLKLYCNETDMTFIQSLIQ